MKGARKMRSIYYVLIITSEQTLYFGNKYKCFKKMYSKKQEPRLFESGFYFDKISSCSVDYVDPGYFLRKFRDDVTL